MTKGGRTDGERGRVGGREFIGDSIWVIGYSLHGELAAKRWIDTHSLLATGRAAPMIIIENPIQRSMWSGHIDKEEFFL